MGKGQSGRQDGNKAGFSKENAMPAKKQPFASRGQTAKEDFHGPFSKEVSSPPAEKYSGRVFRAGQAYAGPYTTNKVDTGKWSGAAHDAGGNPKGDS